MEEIKLYKEVTDEGRILSAQEQEDPLIMISVTSTSPVEATEKEIEESKINHEKGLPCKVHLFYDVGGPIYDQRICGICGKHIAWI